MNKKHTNEKYTNEKKYMNASIRMTNVRVKTLCKWRLYE